MKAPRGAGFTVLSIIATGLLVGLLAALVPSSQFLGWTVLIGGLAAMAGVGHEQPEVARTLLLAFVVRSLAALIHAYVMPLPDSQADARYFESVGWEWASEGLVGVCRHFNVNLGWKLYPWSISLIYSFTDRSPLMIQAFNVLLGTLVVYNVYQSALLLGGSKQARKAALAAALFPSLILYSAITLREMAVVYPLTLGIHMFLRWKRENKSGQIVISLIGIFISSLFHTGMLSALAVVISLFAVQMFRLVCEGRLTAAWKQSAVALFVLILLGSAIQSGRALDKIGVLSDFSFDRVGQKLTASAQDRAQYLSNLRVTTPKTALLQSPTRVAYFLFSPFMWMIRKPEDAFGVLDGLLQIGFFVTLIRRLGRIRNTMGGLSLVFVLVALVAVFAFGTSNYGTAIRHRAKLVPLVLVLISASDRSASV